MTWPAAYRIADEQIVFWKRAGVSADEAMLALLYDLLANDLKTWFTVRRKLAEWAKKNAEMWEE
jgi:hypothetical protein